MPKLPVDAQPLLDDDTIQRRLETFSLATGLPIWFQRAGTDGFLSAGACAFCEKLQKSPDAKRMCIVSMRDSGMLAFQTGEPGIARCHVGLVRMSVPVVCDGRYQGTLSCGPVLLWDWDDYAVRELAMAGQQYGIGVEDVEQSMTEIQRVSPERVHAISEMLKAVAMMIGGDGWEVMRERRERNEQQAKIAQMIIDSKQQVQEGGDRDAARFLMQKEQELLSKVRLGDRQGAKEILNELLGSILLWNAGNVETLKARSLELVVVISRAAVEVGVQMESLLGMNYRYIRQLSELTEFEDICQWLVRVLDTFIDRVYETRNAKSARFLGDALALIREQYAQPLTLEQVAQQVFISPYYLSHLFKEELGITFVEYVTRVRMEEARRLLMQADLPIQQVARAVGYEDAGYFTKVFKKITGVTPNRYKKGV